MPLRARPQPAAAARVIDPRREVQVIEKLPSGWEVVGQGRTDARGRYDLEALTDWYGNHRYASTSWSFLSGPNMRYRFDPCQTVPV